MVVAALSGVDVDEVEAAVGSVSFARGERYARDRVLRLDWDAASETLRGTVLGQGDVYTTEASFGCDGAGFAEFNEGECSCPVGYNCKHVAAIVLAAIGQGQGRPGALRPASVAPRQAPAPTWEQSLRSLIGAPTASRDADTLLAIEVALIPSSGPSAINSAPRLEARVVRLGRGGWVNGGLTWNGLDSWQVQHGKFATDHVQLLQELYALHRVRIGRTAYYYNGADKSLDLGAFDSPQLWSLLDEAATIGLQLVHARSALGPLERYRYAELCLDVTRDVTGSGGAESVVTPMLRVDDDTIDAVPVRFIGSGGHGVVYVERADIETTADHSHWRLRLAKFARPAPAQLREMMLAGRRLEIPGAGRSRFGDELWPRLRHVVTVVSSDRSFTPPTISAPTLVLHASYGAGHTVDVGWEWAYDVGRAHCRAPLLADPADAGFRDLAAERAVLDSLDVGLPSLFPHAELAGIDTMRFSTEVLPLLADHPGVAVEIGGSPAEYREAGDSLVVGLSTDDVAGETDWFDLGVTITVDGRDVPFAGVFVALASGESHMLLADGAYFSLLKPELQALRRLIEEARGLQESPSGPLRISRFQAGMWDELTELGVVNHQADAWQRQVGGLLAIDSIEATELPTTLAAQLRPYQRDGFGWLGFLWDHRLGGILADDMGLGKTVQSLAVICHAKQSDPTLAPFLVVAPTSVVSNWVSEAARFAPGLSVVGVADTLRRSGRTVDEIVSGADIVVTSYTLFRLDFDAYSAAPWAGLILDEAQYTKNHHSKIYGCARRLVAPFKLAITGTPMENNLMELWSLLSITAPGLFPNPTRFADFYAKPIERRGDVELLAQLRRRIRPLVKRRTKEYVAADLPAKQEQVLDVELHPRHRKIYQTHLQRERQRVLGLIDDFDKNRFTILRSLTLLRQLSLHAGLVDKAADTMPCAKIDTLVEQLGDVIEGGHRALVFSQFTGFLANVRARLDTEGIDYCYLDGRTRKRDVVLQRFKEGSAPVFLISLKAGGVGLNLTEADYCFLLDPWWNPATETQAIDRTHRIGQTRNVMVYRLIARDTIEEKVMALKERKAQLFGSVMDDGDLFSGSLSADDIRGLFS